MRRSRIFFSGGVGDPGPTARKQSGRFCCFFLSPQLILHFTEGVQWFYYRENCTFPRIQGGGGGSDIFQGVQLFPGRGIDTHPGGPDLISPL